MYLRFKPNRTFLFREVLYNYIELTDIEVKAVVDTEVFQRLRYLHQTQLARFVYPSADHTRFQHSLGVAYLMSQFMEQYIKELEEARDIPDRIKSEFNNEARDELILASKIAALLHDVGHAFLSHLAELADLVIGSYDHKDISYRLFNTYFARRLRNYINNYYRDAIDADKVINFARALLKPIKPSLTTMKIHEKLYKELDDHYKKYSIYLVPIWQILHAWLYTVDELDYLMRDGYFTGAIEHGMLDWYRLIKQTTLYYHGRGYLALGIKSLSRFLPAYRRFLIAYKNMYDIVSFHRTTLSFESALLLSLIAGSACRRELANLLNGIISYLNRIMDCFNKQTCSEQELIKLEQELTRLLIACTDDNVIRLIHENYSSESGTFREMLEKFLNRDPPFKAVLQAMYDFKPPIIIKGGDKLQQLSDIIDGALKDLNNALKNVGAQLMFSLNKQERIVYAWNYKDVDYGILANAIIRKPKVYKYPLQNSEVYVKEASCLTPFDDILWAASESGVITKFIICVRDIVAEREDHMRDLRRSLRDFEEQLEKRGFIILQGVRFLQQI